METHLNNLFNFTAEHIRRCLLCSQKGFICEICSSTEVIYPFQLEVTSRVSSKRVSILYIDNLVYR